MNTPRTSEQLQDDLAAIPSADYARKADLLIRESLIPRNVGFPSVESLRVAAGLYHDLIRASRK